MKSKVLRKTISYEKLKSTFVSNFPVKELFLAKMCRSNTYLVNVFSYALAFMRHRLSVISKVLFLLTSLKTRKRGIDNIFRSSPATSLNDVKFTSTYN